MLTKTSFTPKTPSISPRSVWGDDHYHSTQYKYTQTFKTWNHTNEQWHKRSSRVALIFEIQFKIHDWYLILQSCFRIGRNYFYFMKYILVCISWCHDSNVKEWKYKLCSHLHNFLFITAGFSNFLNNKYMLRLLSTSHK